MRRCTSSCRVADFDTNRGGITHVCLALLFAPAQQSKNNNSRVEHSSQHTKDVCEVFVVLVPVLIRADQGPCAEVLCAYQLVEDAPDTSKGRNPLADRHGRTIEGALTRKGKRGVLTWLFLDTATAMLDWQVHAYVLCSLPVRALLWLS